MTGALSHPGGQHTRAPLPAVQTLTPSTPGPENRRSAPHSSICERASPPLLQHDGCNPVIVPLTVRSVGVFAPTQALVTFGQRLGDSLGTEAGAGEDAGHLHERCGPIDLTIWPPFGQLAGEDSACRPRQG